jgi:hypothetical protein
VTAVLDPLPATACPGCLRWVGHNDGCEFLLHNFDGSPIEKPIVNLLAVSNRPEHVIGVTRQALKDAGATRAYIDGVVKQMLSGSYDNVIRIAMQELDWESGLPSEDDCGRDDE